MGATDQAEKIRIKLREKAQAFCGANGVPFSDLPTVPGVHALSLAIRYIEGGRQKFIEYVQLSMMNGNEDARSFMMVYADLSPNERLKCDLDEVCVASGVRPSALMGVLVSNAMEMGTDVGNFVMAATHPDIVEAAVKSAKRIDGKHAETAFKDRLVLLQAMKLAPIPRGASVHVHANASANSQAAAALSAEPSVPGFADDMRAIGSGRTPAARQLADPDADLMASLQETADVDA